MAPLYERLDLELATPAEVPAMSLDAAKEHLRVDWADEDSAIQSFLDAALANVDGRDGVLGRCLIETGWTLYLDAFPTACSRGDAEIRLPLPPLIAVDSIRYVDDSGVMQTLDASAYQVLTGERAAVVPAFNGSWPQARRQPRAVIITFRAGYAQAKGNPAKPNPSDVPKPILAAVKLMLGDLYLNRESQVVTGTRSALIENAAAARLLAPLCATWL